MNSGLRNYRADGYAKEKNRLGPNSVYIVHSLIQLRVNELGVPAVAQWVKNTTYFPWGCGFNPWPPSVG